MQSDPIVIVSAKRTPIGGFQGALSTATSPQLGATAIRSALDSAENKDLNVDEVTMGCVLPAGLGQAPARQAALGAGLAQSVPCTTINKMCGSGMKAAMLAHDALLCGSANVAVAGGLESMSNAPYLLPKARSGMRMGHAKTLDHMFLDGLEDAYEPGRLMGTYAENTAAYFGFSREEQDAFARCSFERARDAATSGAFDNEIAPQTVKTKRSDVVVNADEAPDLIDIEKIPTLRAAFAENGTVTAANSSSISDGAAALLMMRESHAIEFGEKPLARILAHHSYAHEPAWFTTAPVHAITGVLDRINRSVNDIDLFEINEAFAVVTMATMRELKIPHERVNVHGGACALGHPIGASGARILVTLIHALHKYNKTLGVASLCIGGGEATAMAVERM